MADEESPTIPPFLPLSEETQMARLLNAGVAQATEALRPILFGGKETPFEWTVKSVMIEVVRDGRRYQIVFVGERWAGLKQEDRKPTKEFVADLKKRYDTLDAAGKEAADSMFTAIGGVPFSELIKETEVDEEAGRDVEESQGGEG